MQVSQFLEVIIGATFTDKKKAQQIEVNWPKHTANSWGTRTETGTLISEWKILTTKRKSYGSYEGLKNEF